MPSIPFGMGQHWRRRGRTALTVAARPRRVFSSSAGFVALGALVLLAGCATQSASAVAPSAPGFLYGLWHGFIFPVAWILSLFMPDVSVYAVPNNGGWYDFGYFIGVVFLGVGARKSHVVYRDRVVRR